MWFNRESKIKNLFARFLFLFTLIPLVEILILIGIGSRIGALNTVILVIAMALFGAGLARYQGLNTLLKIRQSLYEGRIPADELLDSLIIFIAGILLITPGLLSDLAAILFLIPFTRNWFKKWIKRKMQDWINHGKGPVNFKIGF